MTQKLLLKPINGLANRLRAIASAIALLDRHENLVLEIVWDVGSDLSARYTDLFEPLNHPRVCFGSSDNHPILMPYHHLSRSHWKRIILGAIHHSVRILDELLKPKLRLESMFPDIDTSNAEFAVRFRDKAIITTCSEFLRNGNWGHFVLKSELLDRVRSIEAELGDRSIGVHIRRTDNKRSWLNSPLTVFIKKIEEELNKDPRTMIFLATDSDDVRTALLHIFGDERIVTQGNAQIARSSTRAMEDAVVDIWCLSRTDRILGSYWSSFSFAAAEIGGGVPLSICTVAE